MSEYFTCISSDPYDRHDYEIVQKNGVKIVFDNWQDTQQYWFEKCQIPDLLDFVIVKNKQKQKFKGFGK